METRQLAAEQLSLSSGSGWMVPGPGRTGLALMFRLGSGLLAPLRVPESGARTPREAASVSRNTPLLTATTRRNTHYRRVGGAETLSLLKVVLCRQKSWIEGCSFLSKLRAAGKQDSGAGRTQQGDQESGS